MSTFAVTVQSGLLVVAGAMVLGLGAFWPGAAFIAAGAGAVLYVGATR